MICLKNAKSSKLTRFKIIVYISKHVGFKYLWFIIT